MERRDRDSPQPEGIEDDPAGVLSRLIDNVPGIVYRCRTDPGWPMAFVSEGCKEVTGYDREAIESGEIGWEEDVIHPDDAGVVRERVQSQLADDDQFTVQYRILTADAETRWVWERGSRVASDPELIEGVVTDVTEQKETERTLREEVAFTESLLDAQPDLVYAFDTEAETLRWNEKVVEVTGYSPEVIDRLAPWEFVVDEHADRVRSAVCDVLESGETATFEATLETADGDRIPHEFTASPLVDDGEIAGVTGVGRDVSERKRQEKRLRREHERWAALFENTSDAIAYVELTDDDAVIRSVNPAFAETFGFDPDDVVTKRCSDVLVPADHREGFTATVETVRSGEEVRTNVRRETAVGHREFLLRAVPVQSGEPRVSHAFAVYTDVTADTLREQQVEVLNRVLRHNLRNSMNVINGYAADLLDASDDPGVRKAARKIRDAGDELLATSRKAKDLHDIARTHHQPEPVDLVPIVETAVDRIEAQYPDLDPQLDLPESAVALATPHVETAVYELCDNVAEHTSDATPVVSVAERDRWVEVAVSDKGPGIPAYEREVLERGAESALQHGSGLGLWLVNWVVRSVGGEIAIAGNAAGGTTVTLRLPRTPSRTRSDESVSR